MKLKSVALAAVMVVAAVGAVSAQTPQNIGTFQDWNAFVSNDPSGKICFVASQPTDAKYSQSVSGRDPAFFQITSIPTKNIIHEASSIVGYTFAADADVTADVDGTKFKMFLDDSHPDTAWSVPDTEAALVEAMKRGHQLVLTGKSKRGTIVTDTYSLRGITAALEKIDKECAQ